MSNLPDTILKNMTLKELLEEVRRSADELAKLLMEKIESQYKSHQFIENAD